MVMVIINVMTTITIHTKTQLAKATTTMGMDMVMAIINVPVKAAMMNTINMQKAKVMAMDTILKTVQMNK